MSMLQSNPQLMTLIQQQFPTIQAAIQSGNISSLIQLANQFISSGQVQISPPVAKQAAIPNLSILLAMLPPNFQQIAQQYMSMLQSNPQLMAMIQQQLPTIQAAVQQYMQTGNFNSLIQLASQFLNNGLPASKQLVIPNFDVSAMLTQAQQIYPNLDIPHLFQFYLPFILSYPGLGQLVQTHQQEIQTAVATGNYQPLINLATQLFSSGTIGAPNSKQAAIPNLSTLLTQVSSMLPPNFQQIAQQYMSMFQNNQQVMNMIQQQLPAIQAAVQQYMQTGSFSQLLSLAGQFMNNGLPASKQQFVFADFNVNTMLAQAQQIYPNLDIPHLFQFYLPAILSYPGLGQLIQTHSQEIQTAAATGNYLPIINLATQLFSSGTIGAPSSKQAVDLQSVIALFNSNPQLAPFSQLIAQYSSQIQPYLPQLMQYWPQLQQVLPGSVSMIPAITELINQAGFGNVMQSILQALSNNSLVPQVQPVFNGGN